MRHNNRQLISLLLASLLTLPALALESDAAEEITIKSDRAELDRKAGTAIYIGDVILEQGTLKITADRITLFSNEQRELTKAVAIGLPAHFQQQMEEEKGLTQAQGKTITYLTPKKHVTLLGDATLKQEGSVFTGETIIYDIFSENVSAKGESQTELNPDSEQKPSRVKMIIQPETAEPDTTESEAIESTINTEKVAPSEDA
jgi:lipopolysaccharide export system protein LptA